MGLYRSVRQALLCSGARDIGAATEASNSSDFPQSNIAELIDTTSHVICIGCLLAQSANAVLRIVKKLFR